MCPSKHQALNAGFMCLLLGIPILAGNAHAAGFGVIEQSVTGLGNAFAGGSSSATDASTIFYNPAGMSYLTGRQANLGVQIIDPTVKFTDQGSTHLTTVPLDVNNELGGDAGPVALVPNFYYSRPINQQWNFGLGINAPFGLTTDYNDGWVGRYHALTSELKTVNINPSLAYKLNDQLSLGFGVNAQYIQAKLTNAVDYGGICIQSFTATCAARNLASQADDGEAEVKGDDWSWGYNLGLMWQSTPQTRIGIAYRSRIEHMLKGDGKFKIPSDPATGNASAIAAALGHIDTNVTAEVILPESLSVGFNHEIGTQWTVNGDFTWTNWSVFNELRIKFASGAADSVTTTKWKDSNRYSLGLSYAANKQWVWRGGLAFDESANRNSANLTPRVPDQDRTWLSLGSTYKSSDKLSFDVGYAHLFIRDAEVNKSLADTENSFRGALVGKYAADVNIVSAQARRAF